MMGPKTRPWASRTVVMPASQATAVILPALERSSIAVMMIWTGTRALPMISGTSELQTSPIGTPSVGTVPATRLLAGERPACLSLAELPALGVHVERPAGHVAAPADHDALGAAAGAPWGGGYRISGRAAVDDVASSAMTPPNGGSGSGNVRAIGGSFRVVSVQACAPIALNG